MTPKIQEKLSDWRKEPEGHSALWLPSQSFVYHSLDFGPTITGDDLRSAIELQIEEDSPLPAEQVAWGYYQAEGTSALLLYMTHRATALQSEDPHQTDRPAYPTLLCTVADTPNKNCIRMILSRTELSAVYLQANTPIPQQVKSVVLEQALDAIEPEALNEDVIKQIRLAETTIKAKLSSEDLTTVEAAIFAIKQGKVLDNKTLEVSTYRIHSDGSCEQLDPFVLLNSAQFYNCDIRDKPFLEQKKKQARQEELLQDAVKIGLYAICLLLLFQVLLISGKAWLSARADKVPERTLAVDRVNQKEQLLNSIELFSITAFQPFEALERMNTYRPDTLYFENMQAGTEGKKANEQFFIQLRGIASSAAEADRFAEAMQNDPSFYKVDISDIRSQTRQTNFRLFVQLSGSDSTEVSRSDDL